jgi:hypothetical protein
MRRVRAWIKSHEGNLSTCYKCTLSTVTHELNVAEHILILAFFLALVWVTLVKSLATPFSYTLHIEYSLVQQDDGTQYYEITSFVVIFI